MSSESTTTTKHYREVEDDHGDKREEANYQKSEAQKPIPTSVVYHI